jgi:hypothetical protein
MKKLIALLGTMTALALTPVAANAATTTTLGTFPPASPFFFTTSATPTFSSVTAIFGSAESGAFDDIFTFTLPLDGLGSGSVSTSFSGPGNFLQITGVIINGVSESVTAAALGISGVPITANVLNTIEIIGTATGTGTFSGTATFTAATAVPEPATWATFLLGFGFLGLGLRRRSIKDFANA